jgi:hypothetical protein
MFIEQFVSLFSASLSSGDDDDELLMEFLLCAPFSSLNRLLSLGGCRAYSARSAEHRLRPGLGQM